ncbi:uncharacterized protein GGS22DRAFT_144996 [Annulohypoxylon maeteangense]|uniref:uncharacterized protein n=1 Tax=Annulohypoxylon maeteangense TaxID=1927788 RepID=UPI0020075621|nr:uncharacterized protein GGS22DRAFT_144996 [Annulohypoxylon maeteangense]KAI0884627.1 hypothetical protein GGS22DRAFT_144996 [Annulohypoxylon maeteangense]
MRIFTQIDGSIYGAIRSYRPSPSSTLTLSLHRTRIRDDYTEAACTCFPAIARCFCTGRDRKRHHVSCASISKRSFSSTIASSRGRPWNSGFFKPNLPSNRKWNHASAHNTISPSLSQETRPKHELLDIVGSYEDTTVEEHLEFLRDPYMRRFAPADGPHLTVSDRAEDADLQSVHPRETMDPEQAERIRNLQEAVLLKLRRPASIDLDTVYDLYLSLMEPRILQITARLRHQLLAVLGMAEKRNSKSMLRYFTVVTDIKNGGFPLTRPEWNTAMSFASRYVGRSTEVEVEAALQIWREMEHEAGIRGSEVTFNILFDVASKAGKFGLAEMIYQEMGTRGFQFNRYHHVSLIHFFGLKLDSGGVRAAYKEMVESSEVIDSTVLNCVISGFLRCGEESSAERVYEKMRESARGTEVLPDLNYTMQKVITKVLMMFAKIGTKHPEMRSSFQKTALISPDLQTYRFLINHYGARLGDLPKVAQFLDEMKLCNVPLHGAIFLALFKAFGKYGRTGSDWSEQRLTSVYNAFLDALDAGTEGLYINTWMAMAILRAFSRCSSRDELLDIYESLRQRWKLDPMDSEFMMNFLTKVIEEPRFVVRSKGYSL